MLFNNSKGSPKSSIYLYLIYQTMTDLLYGMKEPGDPQLLLTSIGLKKHYNQTHFKHIIFLSFS